MKFSSKEELFLTLIREGIVAFRKLKIKDVKLVSHLDCDGITSASIASKFLAEEGINCSLSIVNQLDLTTLNELKDVQEDMIVFTDLGSGQINQIIDKLHSKKVLILDHHETEKKDLPENIIHINPWFAEIDGSKEISGSGVTYLFASEANPSLKKYAHIALIGAIGDCQITKFISILNSKIIEDAVQCNALNVKQAMRLFGMQTRPLHKLLEYSEEIFIPGVTGSESRAIQFLNEIGIDPRKGKDWKRYIDLTEEEIQRLHTSIIIRRINEENPADIFGPTFELLLEQPGYVFRDAKEFSTLLNACGRLGQASLGVGACLNDTASKRKALKAYKEYKGELVSAIQWFTKEKNNTEYVIRCKQHMIIRAGNKVKHTIIGTLASIIAKSSGMPENSLILSLATSPEGIIKSSLRVSGIRPDPSIDCAYLISQIASALGIKDCGGHSKAAGAVFPEDKEEEFLKYAQEILNKNIKK